MKKRFRKPVVLFALMLAACYMLMGCSKEKTFLVTLNGIESYTLVDYPEGITGGVTDDGVTVTIEKYGDYTLSFVDADGKEFKVTLNYSKDGISGACDNDDITGLSISSY